MHKQNPAAPRSLLGAHWPHCAGRSHPPIRRREPKEDLPKGTRGGFAEGNRRRMPWLDAATRRTDSDNSPQHLACCRHAADSTRAREPYRN